MLRVTWLTPADNEVTSVSGWADRIAKKIHSAIRIISKNRREILFHRKSI